MNYDAYITQMNALHMEYVKQFYSFIKWASFSSVLRSYEIKSCFLHCLFRLNFVLEVMLVMKKRRRRKDER